MKYASWVNNGHVSPYTGEWIEIITNLQQNAPKYVSPYIGEWIEILVLNTVMITPMWRLTLHR